MAPLSLAKTLAPTTKEAGWGPVMSKDGRKLNSAKGSLDREMEWLGW